MALLFYFTEYHEFWPGAPRDLNAKKLLIAEKQWMANFTWNPPYDGKCFVLALNTIFIQCHLHSKH